MNTDPTLKPNRTADWYMDVVWPLLPVPGEFDGMDACDQLRWRSVVRLAIEYVLCGERGTPPSSKTPHCPKGDGPCIRGCKGWECRDGWPDDPTLKPDIAALKKRLSEDPGFAAQVTGEQAAMRPELALFFRDLRNYLLHVIDMGNGEHYLDVVRLNAQALIRRMEILAAAQVTSDRPLTPGCRTPEGCSENGCLGWCDEHKPEVATRCEGCAELRDQLRDLMRQAKAAQIDAENLREVLHRMLEAPTTQISAGWKDAIRQAMSAAVPDSKTPN